MSDLELASDEGAIFGRFDRSSPDALLKSIAAEFRRLHEANARLRAKVAAMEALSVMADRIVSGEIDDFGAEPPASVRIVADQYFPESGGFHPTEFDKAGRPYRWSGPSRHFAFQVFVKRRATARFLLAFDDFFAATAPEELRCFVDGEPTPMKIQRAGDHFEALGLLPIRADKGATALVFVCPRTGSPKDRGDDDSRQLGLAFRLLAIDAVPGGEIEGRAPQP